MKHFETFSEMAKKIFSKKFLDILLLLIKTIDLGLVGSRRQYTSRGVFKTLMLKK